MYDEGREKINKDIAREEREGNERQGIKKQEREREGGMEGG